MLRFLFAAHSAGPQGNAVADFQVAFRDISVAWAPGLVFTHILML